MYVSQILNYDGYQGFIIVSSYGGVTPIPSTAGATLTATANGVVSRLPPTTGDFVYTLGSPGVLGRNNVTHNQTRDEVAVHSHIHRIDPPGPTGNGLVGFTEQFSSLPSNPVSGELRNGDYIATSPLPTSPVIVGTNNTSTISTFQVSTAVPGGYENPTNIGTYTAPNFINMLYIIKV
jgi:hypothetical protein